MITYMYAIKDELTQTFMQPIFIKAVESDPTGEQQAIRLFSYQINNTPVLTDSSSDYSLYMIGIFDEGSGKVAHVTDDGTPKKIANGFSVKERKEK